MQDPLSDDDKKDVYAAPSTPREVRLQHLVRRLLKNEARGSDVETAALRLGPSLSAVKKALDKVDELLGYSGECPPSYQDMDDSSKVLAAAYRSNLARIKELEAEASIARQAAEGRQPATDIYYIGLFQEQMRLRKAAEAREKALKVDVEILCGEIVITLEQWDYEVAEGRPGVVYPSRVGKLKESLASMTAILNPSASVGPRESSEKK